MTMILAAVAVAFGAAYGYAVGVMTERKRHEDVIDQGERYYGD